VQGLHLTNGNNGAFHVKHGSSRALYDYWDAERGQRAAPERSDVEPGRIGRALGDSFLLALDSSGGHHFRLAGTRLCALFGRELKGLSFDLVWEKADRARMRDLVTLVADEASPLVAGAIGYNGDGEAVDLELLILPLRHHGLTHARQIGVLAPLHVPFWLGAKPLLGLTLGMHRHLEGRLDAPVAVSDASSEGRRRNGLIVYDGGRA
jgi:hypothetical protein